MTIRRLENFSRRDDTILLGTLVVGVGTVLFTMIYWCQPEYLVDYRLQGNPDARHYVLLGHNVFQYGEYSRCEQRPFSPDVLRTPIYPIVAGGLDRLFHGVWAIFLFQGICLLAMVLSTYYFGRRFFSRKVAFVAGILVATDLTLAIGIFATMSESLFNALATIAVLAWLRELLSETRSHKLFLQYGVFGIILGLAILTRPAAVYLPIVFIVIAGGVSWLQRCWQPLLKTSLLAVVAIACLIPWVARNYYTFGVGRLTTADTINLVYFAAAGGYSLKHGISREESQERISKEYDLVSLVNTNNPWLADRSISECDRQQREAAKILFSKYRNSIAQACLIGIGKSLISHNVSEFAHMTKTTWHAPGLNSLAQGDFREFSAHLGRNDWWLVLVFILEESLAVVQIALAIMGVGLGLSYPATRTVAMCLLLVMCYYLLTISVVGLDAYCRHRSMLIPFLAIFAGKAIDWSRNWLDRRRASTDLESLESLVGNE
jgi:4-amino-4-deoxy-L-arabinose transferase-like glycosyltransferase